MIGEALSFPKEGESWIKTVLIGGVLLLFSWLIIPTVLVQGYLLRVLRAGSEKAAEPPVFDEWGDLFVDGLKLFVVTLGYFIVPILLAVVLGSVAGALDSGAIGALVGIVVFVAYLVAAYLLPAGLTNMAREGSIGAAFDTDVVLEVGRNSEYAVAVVLGILLSIVLGGIAAMLSIVLIGFFLLFYVNIAVYYLFGRGYGEAMGTSAGAADVASGSPGTLE